MKDTPFTEARLLSLYDRVAEAEDAIPRLRRFVLDLAVRGKLVPRQAGDEPASELLKKIAAETVRRARAGEFRLPKDGTALDDKSIPFSLPVNWQWTQIARLGALNPRNSAEDDQVASFVPMPMIAAEFGVQNGHEIRKWSEIKQGYTHFAEGDVGLAKITPCFENGKSTIFKGLTGGIGAGTTELHILRPVLVLPEYVLVVLKSPYFVQTGIPKMTGTAGQKRVSTEYFAYSPFPLPPLAEQHRIVAKVEELMALLDRLEAARAAREEARTRLTAATLSRLTEADTDTPTAARFALQTLPALTTRHNQTKTLRQTILNLAVRGKLVEQDARDAVEKRSSVADSAFAIPTSWTWQTVAACAKSRLGKMLDKGKNRGTPRPYLRNLNVRWFDFDLSDLLEMPFEDSELDEFTLLNGDVLICEGGEPGRAAVWDSRRTDVYFQKAIHRVRFDQSVDSRYFVLALKASADDGRLAEYFTGTGIKHFTGKGLSSYAFPLPPLAEQHRIVAKVEELMSLCDRLERALQDATTTRARLLDATLREALHQTEPA